MDKATRFRSHPHPLWTLALVCHRWREIIHSSADLWSYIRIDANPELYIFRDHYKASRRAAMHLHYSGLCPLTVHIGSSDMEGRSYGPLNTQLSWILLPYAPRIKTLILEINTRGIAGLDILRGGLSGLETLLLSSHAPPEMLFLQAIFKECPRLQRVELLRVSVERLEVQLPPSVRHLVLKPAREDTQYPNARVNIPRIALCVQTLRHLQSLSFELLDFPSVDAFPEIPLPGLQALSITVTSELMIPIILKTFVTPNLKELILTATQQWGGTDDRHHLRDVLKEFMERCSYGLTLLHLMSLPFLTLNFLIELLSTLPDIEELGMTGSSTAGVLLGYAAKGETGGWLVPKLRTLRLKMRFTSDILLGRLSDFLRERQNWDPPLRELDMCWAHDDDSGSGLMAKREVLRRWVDATPATRRISVRLSIEGNDWMEYR